MMKKIISKISKIRKEKFVFILIIFIVIVIMGLYQTFSMLTESIGVSYSNNTKTYSFIIGSNKENEIIIKENDTKFVDVLIKNDKEIDLTYALYYNLDKEVEDITIGYLEETKEKPNGIILANDSKVISLKIINNSNQIVKINIGINSGTLNGGEIKKSGTRITEVITNLDKEKVNRPELGNDLIPVYYNLDNNKWYKADESNQNSKHKWYNYDIEEKMWANAVLVSDTTKTSYLNAPIGTPLQEQDIKAFFVWIPRYKYRIWNILGDTNKEIYNAKDNGVEIKFESGTNSTGNLKCMYNNNLTNVKNDNCQINGKELTENIDNIDTEIWYTHPAFTYGEKELTGIWIGKYETTGSIDNPTILPDTNALRNINISSSFTATKLINTYIRNSNLDSHLIKNTEWGAITYLTNSIYGLCNKEKCEEIFNNNSKLGITGRSSGSPNEKATNDGIYSYDGYMIIEESKDNTRDFSKIASTTKNIYGIYDLSGGLSEYVMGNMQSIDKELNTQNSGTNWNKTRTLAPKYYDNYAYGDSSDDNNAMLRTRIGDATGEITIDNNEKKTTWNNDNEISFVNKDNSWFIRGGDATEPSGIYNYKSTKGEAKNNIGFRISLA